MMAHTLIQRHGGANSSAFFFWSKDFYIRKQGLSMPRTAWWGVMLTACPLSSTCSFLVPGWRPPLSHLSALSTDDQKWFHIYIVHPRHEQKIWRYCHSQERVLFNFLSPTLLSRPWGSPCQATVNTLFHNAMFIHVWVSRSCSQGVLRRCPLLHGSFILCSVRWKTIELNTGSPRTSFLVWKQSILLLRVHYFPFPRLGIKVSSSQWKWGDFIFLAIKRFTKRKPSEE